MAIGISHRLTMTSERPMTMPVPDVRTITPDDYPAWDQFVALHGQGGPYLSTAWKTAVEQGYGHKTIYLAAYGNHGITGVLPLVHIKPPITGGTLVSLPFCDYGGILASHPRAAASLLRQAVSLSRRLKTALEIRSAHTSPAIEHHPGFAHVTDKCRMVLKLPGNSDLLWSGFKSKLRSQVKRGVKDGLVCRIGRHEQINDFYRVFSHNMRDLGSPVHSRTWIEKVLSAFGGKAATGIVYTSGRPIGAGIILMHGGMVTIPWASTLAGFNRLSPNMLLYWTFLKNAADNGYGWFDFGRSTPGEGTYAFKKQWGAKPMPLAWYRHDHGFGRPRASAKTGSLRQKAETLWQKLPLVVANTIGPSLRKYIDR